MPIPSILGKPFKSSSHYLISYINVSPWEGAGGGGGEEEGDVSKF